MSTRASPEDPGEKEGPRWIHAPTAASSQPEAQPQVARLHDNGDGPGTQSTADAESGNFLCNPRRGEVPPCVDRTTTVSGIVHHDSGCIPGGAFRRERLIVVPGEHDDGLLAQWTYDMLSGRWAQPEDVDEDSNPLIAGAPVPRFPQGPAVVAPVAISQCGEQLALPFAALFAQVPRCEGSAPEGQLSLPLDPIRPVPMARSQAATGGQRRKDTTLQAIYKEDRERVKRPGNHTPGIGMVRVVSNPGSDAEDRLRRVFSLMVKHATKDTQDALEKDCPGDFQPHATYGKIA